MQRGRPIREASPLVDMSSSLSAPVDEVLSMPALNVVLAGGGTGGHLFPLLAVSEGINRSAACSRFVFYGTERAVDEDILRAHGCEIVRQPVRPVPKQPWRWPGFLRRWRASVRQCRRAFEASRPDVVVGSGGFGSGPPIHAAHQLGIPTVVLNPDAVPGRANRFLGRRANLICAQWDETAAHFGQIARVVTTGCPVRATFQSADADKGRELFNLRPDRKTLLITGASHGARSINEAILVMLDDLRAMSEWQILHLAGRSDYEHVRDAYAGAGVAGHVVDFTNDMPHALAAADLVLARAGASTLAEITALGKPAILMPYPHHSDMHQLANGRCLVRAGAARIVHDRVRPEDNVVDLKPTLLYLMNDADELRRMAAQAQKIGRLDAAGQIASLIFDLVRLNHTPSEGTKE